jgi:hypothetical protein
MRNMIVLVLSLLLSSTAFADGDRAADPLGDKLLTGGAAAFTIGYAPMTVAGTVLAVETGADSYYGAHSFLPVAGPFWWGADFLTYGRGDAQAQAIAGLAIADGIVQVAGITLMIAGSVHKHRVAAGSTTRLSSR